jgi:plastocyanin domain-containing protein
MRPINTKNLSALSVSTALSLGAALLTIAITPQSAVAHGKNKHIQHVTITVDNAGYHPANVTLKADRETHMTFVSKGSSCANSIKIPALRKTIHLRRGEKKDIVFTPKKGQSIAFACSMDMFKGKVVAK